MADNGKRYLRKVNPGDVSLEGEEANGVTVTSEGNTFIYSSNKLDDVEKKQRDNFNGNIPIDPNNVSSFIGVFTKGIIPQVNDINLGSNNIDSLIDLEETENPQDVLTPEDPEDPSDEMPDSEVSGNINIPTPSPTPPPSPTVITEEDEEGMIFNFDALPESEDEGFQIYEIIQVDNNFQDEIIADSYSLVNKEIVIQTNNARQLAEEKAKKEGRKLTKEELDNLEKQELIAYGSSYRLIGGTSKDEFGDLGVPYHPCALFRQGDSIWGKYKDSKYSLSSHGCCYTSLCMLFTWAKRDAAYTPQFMWQTKGFKSVSVLWSSMANSIGLKVVVKEATMDEIDSLLNTGPLMFEWQSIKGWPKGYNIYKKVAKSSAKSVGESYTCCKQHWMVIAGINMDKTYTVFDPAFGIRKRQSRSQIEAGLNRIAYINK